MDRSSANMRAQDIVSNILERRRKDKERERARMRKAPKSKKPDMRAKFRTADLLYHDGAAAPDEDDDAVSVASVASFGSTQSLPAIFRTTFLEQPQDERRAKKKLTTRSVPRGHDSERPYCASCEFEDCRHCNFCLCSKVSKTHRMPLERFARLLLMLHPAISPQEMGREIARYARSDSIAKKLNGELGWSPGTKLFCDEHARERVAYEESEQSAALDSLHGELVSERKRLKEAHAEVERLKAAVLVGNLDDEKEHERCKFLVSEVERMRGQVHERDELVKVLRDQLDEILTAKDLEERGTQTTIVRHRGAMSQTTLTGDVEASAGDDGDGGGGGEGLGDGRRRTTLRRSMARRRTRAEAPLGNAGPVSQLLEAIYDVHEKKLLADAEAATSGRVPASLDEFVRGYWRDKFRHRKAANKRMAWMFTAIREHMMHNRHVRIVGWVLGMDLTFIMQKEYHYGPMISRMFYSFLAAVVEQDPSLVKRTFDADGKPASKPLAFMLDCLIGLGREGVERDKPGTWKSHQLKLMMRDTHIEGMLARIEAAADADGLVDLDFVFHALMESYNDAIFAHKTQLTKAFYRFDTGTEGMTKEEFIELLRFVLGQNRIKEMSDEELDEIYHRVEDIADDDEECMQIDDGESFASAVLICDFELSLPKFCRAHWSLPDDSDDNRYAPLMARDEADASGSLADVASDIVVRTSFAMTGDASS